jgi:hypothetical protein
MPKDMAVKAENIGIIKAGLDKYRMMALGGIPLTGQEEE